MVNWSRILVRLSEWKPLVDAAGTGAQGEDWWTEIKSLSRKKKERKKERTKQRKKETNKERKKERKKRKAKKQTQLIIPIPPRWHTEALQATKIKGNIESLVWPFTPRPSTWETTARLP